MEKDLANRSVYYVEGSALDPSRHHNHDLVITDQEPVETQDPILNTVFHIQNNVPNNLNSSLGATPRVPQPSTSYGTSTGKADKNVNIDRFKLGHSEVDHRYSEPSTSSGLGGACTIGKLISSSKLHH